MTHIHVILCWTASASSGTSVDIIILRYFAVAVSDANCAAAAAGSEKSGTMNIAYERIHVL